MDGGPTGPEQNEPRAVSQTARYIIVLNDAPVNSTSVSSLLGNQYAFRPERIYSAALAGFVATLSTAQRQQLEADPRVKFVEPDQIFHTTTTTQSPAPSWGLDRIDQLALPLTTSYAYGYDGTGVHFYGIDTGIMFSHPDFGGRASKGYDAVTTNGTAADCNGHGTHTASTAGGTTYGVAKKLTIVAVRVLDCSGSGATSGVIAGVDWVRTHAIKPAVANMSLGGGLSGALDQAVANAVAAGIVFTVSAGNSNASACTQSPAAAPAALTVGATTSTDARASYSNFGTCLDLFAPGSGIKAAVWPSGTASYSGTSMAAPHVAGVAALYLQKNPSATPAQVASALSANAAANKVTSPGSGSPNKLLYMGFIGSSTANLAPVALVTVTCAGAAKCTFDGSKSTDDHAVVSYQWKNGPGTVMSTQATFTKTFNDLGLRTGWTLTVKDAAGLSSTKVFNFTVLP
jgi:subtilisin family serine protease